MKVAIASGKGGVGKTTFATVLAMTAARQGRAAAYLDCDVEAPNGHLLLNPAIDHRCPVTRPIPSVDLDTCGRCGACERACQFGAIVCLGITVQVNPNLCKSCGACRLVCPRDAITEIDHTVGYVETGHVESLHFAHGVLDIGQARSIPVIDAVKQTAPADADLTIIDAPPGTSCPTVTAVREADMVILVAEATAFGLSDLTIAVETMQSLALPIGVIINRCDRGDDRVHAFCRRRGIPILAEVGYSHALAHGYADGSLNEIIEALGEWPTTILEALSSIRARRAS